MISGNSVLDCGLEPSSDHDAPVKLRGQLTSGERGKAAEYRHDQLVTSASREVGNDRFDVILHCILLL